MAEQLYQAVANGYRSLLDVSSLLHFDWTCYCTPFIHEKYGMSYMPTQVLIGIVL